MTPSKKIFFNQFLESKMRYRQSLLFFTSFVIFLVVPLFVGHAEDNDDSYQYSRNVYTWVPPYGRDDTLALLKKMFPEDAPEGVRQYGMADGITHLALQFWSVDETGLISWDENGVITDSEIDEFRKWSHVNGIKVLMCIEAMGDSKWDYANSHYSGSARTDFINAIVQEVKDRSLDGVDIDFEASLNHENGDERDLYAEKELYLSFMKELADRLHAEGKILTCAIFPSAWNIPNPTWYEDTDTVQGLLSITDGIETMNYDSVGVDQPCYSESFYNNTQYALKVPATAGQATYTESEPDNNSSIMNSEFLEYGSTMMGNIDNITDVDFFHFISQETREELRIQLSTLSSNTHWKLTIIDISNNVLVEKKIGTLSYDINSDIVVVKDVVEGQRYYAIIERISFYNEDSSYTDQETKIIDPTLRNKLMLGLPSWLNEWCMSETNMMEHLRWFTENQSDTGIAIWDARLAHPDWQSHKVWELLYNFKYQVSEGNDLIPLQRAVTSLSSLTNRLYDNRFLRDTDGDNRISLADTILELQNSILIEELCSQDDLTKCLDKQSCFSAGGYWDNTSDCVTVPTVTLWDQIWMDRNLGAIRAIRYDDMGDEPEVIGDLYQWGRMTDGHEKRNSSTINNLSSSDRPDPGHFILLDTMSFPFDWRSPPNENLWQGVDGLNNPCPAGFRLPTIEELTVVQQEYSSWIPMDGEFPLPLAPAGIRSCTDGTGGVYDTGMTGFYWSSDVNSENMAQVMMVEFMGMMTPAAVSKAYGGSVRCIKN